MRGEVNKPPFNTTGEYDSGELLNSSTRCSAEQETRENSIEGKSQADSEPSVALSLPTVSESKLILNTLEREGEYLGLEGIQVVKPEYVKREEEIAPTMSNQPASMIPSQLSTETSIPDRGGGEKHEKARIMDEKASLFNASPGGLLINSKRERRRLKLWKKVKTKLFRKST